MGGADDEEPLKLDQIQTDWSRLNEPAQFVLRYAAAIRSYLSAVLHDPVEVEEVTQEFMLRVVKRGFTSADPNNGRFRDYLKAALRNAARTHYRRASSMPPVVRAALDAVAAGLSAPEQAWLDEWRRCLLERVWDALGYHERRSPGNLACTIMKLTLDHPDEDSAALAKRVKAAAGVSLRAAAFRKQLSRARQLFAEFLVREVAATVRPGTREQIEDELATLGFLHYVRDYLPAR